MSNEFASKMRTPGLQSHQVGCRNPTANTAVLKIKSWLLRQDLRSNPFGLGLGMARKVLAVEHFFLLPFDGEAKIHPETSSIVDALLSHNLRQTIFETLLSNKQTKH